MSASALMLVQLLAVPRARAVSTMRESPRSLLVHSQTLRALEEEPHPPGLLAKQGFEKRPFKHVRTSLDSHRLGGFVSPSPARGEKLISLFGGPVCQWPARGL